MSRVGHSMLAMISRYWTLGTAASVDPKISIFNSALESAQGMISSRAQLGFQNEAPCDPLLAWERPFANASKLLWNLLRLPTT